MQPLLAKSSVSRLLLYVTLLANTLLLATSCIKKEPEPTLRITTLASGLSNPLGLSTDKSGRVWVVQGGTGKNDGKVSVISPDGKVTDVIVNFASVIFEGDEPDGPTHLLFSEGILFILGRGGKLYKVEESALKPGMPPMNASSLAVEDIAPFVLGYNFVNNAHDSHPYNLTAGPGGALYITDAGANAIIRRSKTGALSVLAEIPGVLNPTSVGPPKVESVPTGILYDGQYFYVTTLLGFPFPPGKSVVYKVTTAGAVTDFQQGFTSLVDIAAGNAMGRLVLEHGVFGQFGFAPKTGRLVWATGNKQTQLANGLNLPAGLTQANEHTWYVSSLGDGSVLKVTY